jgi:hypothetical protein
MNEQWTKGLQWGALAALLCLTWQTLRADAGYLAYFHDQAPYRLACALHAATDAILLGALALQWTRWSRLAILAVIVADLLMIGISWRGYPMTHSTVTGLPFATQAAMFAVSSSPVLGLLPLLVLEPEHPRLTTALALVGRWRDAARSLTGWRWILVALGVYLLGSAVESGLAATLGDDDTRTLVLWEIVESIAPCVAFFGLAALPRRLRLLAR